MFLSFTVTTNKHTTHKHPQTQQTHNTTKPTSTQRHKTNKHTPQKQQTHKPPKQTNPHNQHTHSPTKPATAAPTAEHSGPWVSTNIAEPGFNPGTFGLWAQHANHCATPLLLKMVKKLSHNVPSDGIRKEGRKQEQKGTESMGLLALVMDLWVMSPTR